MCRMKNKALSSDNETVRGYGGSRWGMDGKALEKPFPTFEESGGTWTQMLSICDDLFGIES